MSVNINAWRTKVQAWRLLYRNLLTTAGCYLTRMNGNMEKGDMVNFDPDANCFSLIHAFSHSPFLHILMSTKHAMLHALKYKNLYFCAPCFR